MKLFKCGFEIEIKEGVYMTKNGYYALSAVIKPVTELEEIPF